MQLASASECASPPPLPPSQLIERCCSLHIYKMMPGNNRQSDAQCEAFSILAKPFSRCDANPKQGKHATFLKNKRAKIGHRHRAIVDLYHLYSYFTKGSNTLATCNFDSFLCKGQELVDGEPLLRREIVIRYWTEQQSCKVARLCTLPVRYHNYRLPSKH